MIYWTNWNIDRPTIERSSLNGSGREIVVQRDLIMPHGLGLDIERQTIYWANNLRFGSFVIERSRVDGSDRQRIYEGKGQFIFGLTVTAPLISITRRFRAPYFRWGTITSTGPIGITKRFSPYRRTALRMGR